MCLYHLIKHANMKDFCPTTHFKIHDPGAHHDTNTQKYRCSLIKRQINHKPLMVAYERSESARDNLGKFIHQFQPDTKTLIRKLETILINLYR